MQEWPFKCGKYLIEACSVGHDQALKTDTAFCWAAWQNHLPVCRYLREHAKCNARLTNTYGCNAALWAAQGGASTDMCRYLANAGVPFDVVNANGQGPLHKAAQRGCADICEWLLTSPNVHLSKAHFSPNAAEASTPSELARMAGHNDCERLWPAER